MLDRATYLHELRRQSQADSDTRFGTGPHNRRVIGVTIQDLRKRARRRQRTRDLAELVRTWQGWGGGNRTA